MEKGETTTLIKTATKLLTQKFGPIPKSIIEKIQSSDTKTLEGIIEGIFTYQSLDDVKKHLN